MKYFKIKTYYFNFKKKNKQTRTEFTTLHYTQKIEHLGQRNHIKVVSNYLQNIIKV